MLQLSIFPGRARREQCRTSVRRTRGGCNSRALRTVKRQPSEVRGFFRDRGTSPQVCLHCRSQSEGRQRGLHLSSPVWLRPPSTRSLFTRRCSPMKGEAVPEQQPQLSAGHCCHISHKDVVAVTVCSPVRHWPWPARAEVPFVSPQPQQLLRRQEAHALRSAPSFCNALGTHRFHFPD